MPIIPQDQVLKELMPEPTPPMENPKETPTQDQDPSFWDKVSTPWVRGNSAVSALINGVQKDEVTNPNFDFTQEIKGTPYAEEAEKFIYTSSPEEVEQVKQQIDKEQHDIDIMQHSGTIGFISGLAAGATDPIFSIPAAAAFAATGGASGGVMATALGGVAAGATGATAEELALHQSQLLRTKQESFENIASAAALGGILGGAGASLGAADRVVPNAILSNIMKTGEPGKIVLPPLGGSIGAAKVDLSAGDASIAGLPKAVINATQIPGLKQPVLEGLNSDSPWLRNVTSKLFETDLILNKNKAEGENIPTDIAMQTKLNLDSVDILNYQKDIKKLYLKYNGTNEGAFEAERAAFNANQSGKMSMDQFNEQVAGAMRRGDRHDNPYVEAAAQRGRAEITKLNQRMQQMGILPEELNLKDDVSYLTNVYDVDKILKDRSAFEKVIADHYEAQGFPEKHLGTEDIHEYAKQAASDAVDHIIGIGDRQISLSDISRMALDKGTKFTKERVINVPSTKMEPWLKNDSNQIVSMYMKQAQQMIRHQEFLESEGVKSPLELPQKLKDEYNENMNKISIAKENKTITEDQYNKLSEQYSRSLTNNTNLLSDFQKIMLGQYTQHTKYDKAISYLKTYNYIRLMGNFTMTAIPHLAAGVIRHGIGNTLMDGLVGSLRIMLDGAKEAHNLDLRDMHIGTELETNNVLKVLTDPDFSGGYRNNMQKAADIGSDVYSKMSGISYFVNTSQRFFSNVAMSRIMRDIKNYDSLPASEKTYLNSIHIGEADIKPMLEQFERFGTTVKGGHILNTAQWENRVVAEKMNAAMQTEANAVVPRAGQGDVPRLIQRYPLARGAFQFHNFFAAVSSKILLSGLQRRDAYALQGMISLISLGALSYTLKEYAQGREPDLSPTNLAMEGFNRSGLLGLWHDPIIGLGIKSFTDKGMSRYLHKTPSEYLLGPSAALVNDIYNIGRDTMTGQANDKTAKRAISLLPFQNLWYLRMLFDRMNR